MRCLGREHCGGWGRWWKVVGVASSSLAEVSISSNKKTKKKMKNEKTYYRAKQHI